MNEPTDLKWERDELAAFNPDYARKEKMLRMFAGCLSEPFRYRDGVVEIEIRLSDRALASGRTRSANSSPTGRVWCLEPGS